jgi:exodeoxyribonuclease-3
VLRIATWNVNSIRQRLGQVLTYLKETSPDALCLQEIKCLDQAFPRAEIEELGYNVATHGQKGFNGVAILSKRPFETKPGLPGDPNDEQARYIEAEIPTGKGALRVASIYLPNGNPVDSEKYPYKLAFMDRLIVHAKQLLALEEPLVLAGDFNVIPEARDAAKPEQWVNDALFLPETCAQRPTRTAFTHFGISRRSAGKRTTASASTISCCRRKPPTS